MATVAQIAARIRRFEAQMMRRVEDDEIALLRIFLNAEHTLFSEFSRIAGGFSIAAGNIDKEDIANLSRIESMMGQIDTILKRELIGPGRDWADNAVVGSYRDGRRLAQINMQVVDERLVREAFAAVTPAEVGILQSGLSEGYKSIGKVGSDIAEYLRTELTEAAILGRPVQGSGSLAERLFEGGQLRPVVVQSKEGKPITRSIKQQSVTIARVETAKIANRVHQVKTEEAFALFGDEKIVYANINPEDDVTTDICMRASQQEPMTLEEWDASEFGRAPRYEPFHLCRSVLLAGTRRMFRN